MADWDQIESKGNINDRRGLGGMVLSRAGLTTIALLMGATYLMGGNPLEVLQMVDVNQLTTSENSEQPAEFQGEDKYEQFVATVLGSTNDTWETMFATTNPPYEPPELVLFRGSTQSACGGALSQYGPHYCPTDRTIYLDETFFDELEAKLGASNEDVAQAYVIAHEVGHHVQNIRGELTQSRESNEASIATELQADCYAGLWAHSLRDDGVFAEGEIKEALDAAAAVGDDHIQETTTGEIHKETWTHGSSAARVAAFTRGYENGTVASCASF